MLTLELHQAIGMKHERLGMAKVKLRELAINGGDQVNARTLLMGKGVSVFVFGCCECIRVL